MYRITTIEATLDRQRRCEYASSHKQLTRGSTGPETESDVCALPCADHYGTQEYVVQSSAKVYYSNTVLCY